MRIIRDPKHFKEELEAAKRESKKNFGDDHVIIEKYIEKPRHIEV
jgi:3-methylcrotonyl-CoA carboxylase alpha subunit